MHIEDGLDGQVPGTTPERMVLQSGSREVEIDPVTRLDDDVLGIVASKPLIEDFVKGNADKDAIRAIDGILRRPIPKYEEYLATRRAVAHADEPPSLDRTTPLIVAVSDPARVAAIDAQVAVCNEARVNSLVAYLQLRAQLAQSGKGEVETKQRLADSTRALFAGMEKLEKIIKGDEEGAE